MIYEEFVAHIIRRLRLTLDDSVTIQLLHLPRNNGTFRDALCLRQSEYPASPAIYLDEFWKNYQNGLPLTMIEEEILTCHREASKHFSDFSLPLDDFEKVKNLLSVKLIHRGKNAELLKQLPHQDLLDLSLVYYLYLSPEGGPAATALVHREHLQIWDIGPEDLHHVALENAQRTMPPMIRTLDEFICDIMARESMNPEILPPFPGKNDGSPSPVLPMYVLTNIQNYLGASCIVYPEILESFSIRCQGSFYLLPSSVHEMILIPQLPNLNARQLEHIVEEINDEIILPEDRLSNHIYRYDPGKGISFALTQPTTH